MRMTRSKESFRKLGKLADLAVLTLKLGTNLMITRVPGSREHRTRRMEKIRLNVRKNL